MIVSPHKKNIFWRRVNSHSSRNLVRAQQLHVSPSCLPFCHSLLISSTTCAPRLLALSTSLRFRVFSSDDSIQHQTRTDRRCQFDCQDPLQSLDTLLHTLCKAFAGRSGRSTISCNTQSLWGQDKLRLGGGRWQAEDDRLYTMRNWASLWWEVPWAGEPRARRADPPWQGTTSRSNVRTKSASKWYMELLLRRGRSLRRLLLWRYQGSVSRV